MVMGHLLDRGSSWSAQQLAEESQVGTDRQGAQKEEDSILCRQLAMVEKAAMMDGEHWGSIKSAAPPHPPAAPPQAAAWG